MIIFKVICLNKNIERIRQFNRFYTRVLGLMNQYTDQSKYSILEAQLLYEIDQNNGCSATELIEYFQIDKGYLSRVLKRLIKLQLIEKRSSNEDKRKRQLYLTSHGKRELDQLVHSANYFVSKMIEHIPAKEQDTLIQAMEQIEQILTKYPGQKNL
jgi:DNA-binding MarR family transcriptional regulator